MRCVLHNQYIEVNILSLLVKILRLQLGSGVHFKDKSQNDTVLQNSSFMMKQNPHKDQCLQ